METINITKSKSGRVTVDGKSKSGLGQLDVKSKSGRGPLDRESKSGRVSLVVRSESGRVPLDWMRIIHPEPRERETAQKYFRYYEPAFGETLPSVRIGLDVHGTGSEAHVGEMVYFDIIADLPPTLYGPYRILDIRRIRLPSITYPAVTHIYVDRFDFITPILPTRLVRESIIKPYDSG